MSSGHPHIAQRKQRHQLRCILGQPFVANLGETELALDHPKWMFDLRAHAGFELLGFLQQTVPRRVLIQYPTFARAHGNVPVHARGFWPLDRSLVTGIRKHHSFLTMQQGMALRDIVDIGCCAYDGVHQTRLCVDTNVRLHAEVPLVAFLGLVHLRVTLTGAVLGGAGCCNQSGVHHRTGLEQQAVGGELGVDHLQDLRAQIMRFEQVAKSQDADPVRNALGTANACEVAVKAGLKQGFFNAQIRQAKPLLWAMNTQHHCQIKWRTSRLGYRCVRGDQRQQLALRHHLLHLIEQSLLERALGAEVQANIFLFHVAINCKLHASVELTGGRVLNMIPKISTKVFEFLC